MLSQVLQQGGEVKAKSRINSVFTGIFQSVELRTLMTLTNAVWCFTLPLVRDGANNIPYIYQTRIYRNTYRFVAVLLPEWMTDGIC